MSETNAPPRISTFILLTSLPDELGKLLNCAVVDQTLFCGCENGLAAFNTETGELIILDIPI